MTLSDPPFILARKQLPSSQQLHFLASIVYCKESLSFGNIPMSTFYLHVKIQYSYLRQKFCAHILPLMKLIEICNLLICFMEDDFLNLCTQEQFKTVDFFLKIFCSPCNSTSIRSQDRTRRPPPRSMKIISWAWLVCPSYCFFLTSPCFLLNYRGDVNFVLRRLISENNVVNRIQWQLHSIGANH